jgi:hypothetical protein
MKDTAVRTVAVMRFSGAPGRDKDAALAWGFELKYYFMRGVGETPPSVTWEDGVYTCAGMMTTSHPHDRQPVTVFDGFDGDPADLDFVLGPDRMARLRELYPRWAVRFDGESEAS